MLENGMVLYTEEKEKTVKVTRWVKQETTIVVGYYDDNREIIEQADDIDEWKDIETDSYDIEEVRG